MFAMVNTPDEAEPVARRETREPQLRANEALVEVSAFSLNRGELALLDNRPAGWRPGQDLAGTVVRQARDDSGPPAGTRIMGLVEQAGWSEKVAVRTDRMAPLHDDTRFEDAAVLPIPGLTALRALRRGGFLLDKSVLVTGATGIVGGLAIQLAASAGARVTAVGTREAASHLRELGATDVVENTADAPGLYELILESIGGKSLKGAIEHVAPGGNIVVYGNTSGEPTPFSFMDFWNAQNARIHALFHFTAEPPTAIGRDLTVLAELLGAGRLRPNIGGEHDWSELAKVIEALKRDRFRGKHVFRIEHTR